MAFKMKGNPMQRNFGIGNSTHMQSNGDLPGKDVVSGLEQSDYKIKNEDASIGYGHRFQPSSRVPHGDGHENYMGVKNEEAGYDQFSLGVQNSQEKALEERFSDLEGRLAAYLGGANKKEGRIDLKDLKQENTIFWPGETVGQFPTNELVLEKGIIDENKVDENGNENPNYGKDKYNTQFDAWMRRQHFGSNVPDPNKDPRGYESFIKNMNPTTKQEWEGKMNEDIETVINLDNDLKEAANNGYHLDENLMNSYMLNNTSSYQPTEQGIKNKEILVENEALQDLRKANIDSTKAMEEFEKNLEKSNGNFTEAWTSLSAGDKKRIKGFRTGGSVDSNLWYGHGDIDGAASSPIIEQNWNRIVGGLQNEATKDGLGSNHWNEEILGGDPTLKGGKYEYNPELEEGVHTEPYQWDYDPRLAKDYDPSNVEVSPPVQTGDVITDGTEEVVEGGTGGVTGDGGTRGVTGDGTGTSGTTNDIELIEEGEELSDIPDSEQENIDRWQEKKDKRAAIFADAATPQTQTNEEGESVDPEAETTGDDGAIENEEGEYVPITQREDEEEYSPQSRLTKTVNSPLDYSKANPFNYGTDDYYGFQKKARSHKLGVAKRIFNVYSK